MMRGKHPVFDFPKYLLECPSTIPAPGHSGADKENRKCP